MFFVEDNANTLMAADVSTAGTTFEIGETEALFSSPELRPLTTQSLWRYDVFPDGETFATVMPADGASDPVTRVRIVQNWYEEFRYRDE